MPIPVTVTVTKKTITAAALGADPAKANEWMHAGSFESVQVVHNAGKLPAKEKKELAAFCAFAGQPALEEIVVRLTGTKPGSVLKVMVLSSAKNEDPPDLILTAGPTNLGIEVTDFPPDQQVLLETMAQHPGAAPLPLFHEGGCSPELIRQFMEAGVSQVAPHFGSVPAEIEALYNYARTIIAQKDASGESQVLLIYGPAAFDYPEAEVIAYVVANTVFQALKAVVFVRQNKSSVYWTNLA